MSKKTKITRKELQEKLSHSVNGGTFINITTETKPKLKGGKKNDQQGRITKVSTSNVMIFQNKESNAYSNMVQRRLREEGKDPESFELKPLPWGERIENTPIIIHEKDGEEKTYLQAIYLNNKETNYFLDGVSIDKDDVIGLPVKPTTGQGGLENQVIIRTTEIKNIKEISINKDKFEVID